jgi:hypothetical protein
VSFVFVSGTAEVFVLSLSTDISDHSTTSRSGTHGVNTPTEPTPPPSQIMVVMYPLPFPGAPGATPTFDGRNVTLFLKKYESMRDNYQVQTALRPKKVLEYCENDIAREIEVFTT